MGTLMTGNVWLHVMPSQRALVAATKAGKPQDRALAYRAKQRSIHNNYMTFPLLFIMVSNHFPSTYGNQLNWLILGILMLAGAAIRHFMNIRFWYGGWLRALFGTAFEIVRSPARIVGLPEDLMRALRALGHSVGAPAPPSMLPPPAPHPPRSG